MGLFPTQDINKSGRALSLIQKEYAMKGITMMKRILAVALAAAALTFVGCNKSNESATEDSATESIEVTTGAVEEAAPADKAEEAPKASAETPAATPAETPAATPAPAPADAAASTSAPATADAAPAAAAGGEVTLPSGTTYVDVVVGTGKEAVAGDLVSVHYTGTLTNGTKFDSSHDRGKPIQFRLGNAEVIKGWDEGIEGMKIGGQRKLTIPPAAGYGNAATGPIPPNSTLLFDVELVGVD